MMTTADLKSLLSNNALTVLTPASYLKKDQEGQILEEPADMFRRVAETVAAAETRFAPDQDVQSLADQFYDAMTRLEFLPNSPTLMNAGRELGQLSACFVLPRRRLHGEHLRSDQARRPLIHKSGGGTGFSFSRVRPANDVVLSTKGVSSGPISFMKVFDAATETIKQGGTRRGANMGILRVDHPDIMDFIMVKKDLTVLTNFNLSVGMTEAFMKAVEAGSEYDLLNPRTGEPLKKTRCPQGIRSASSTMAWTSGEPGIIFP